MFGFGPMMGFQAQWPPPSPMSARAQRSTRGHPPLTEEEQRRQSLTFFALFFIMLVLSFLF